MQHLLLGVIIALEVVKRPWPGSPIAFNDFSAHARRPTQPKTIFLIK